jgi:hypothetical protein
LEGDQAWLQRSSVEGDLEVTGGFAMLEAFDDNARRQCLNAGPGIVPAGAVSHNTGQLGHFAQPRACGRLTVCTRLRCLAEARGLRKHLVVLHFFIESQEHRLGFGFNHSPLRRGASESADRIH